MEQQDLITQGVADIGHSLGGPEPQVDEPVENAPVETGEPVEEAPPEGEPPPDGEFAVEELVTKPAPQSWPKEMHEEWTKVPPKVQEYWELREKQMLDGLGQYKEYHGLGKSLNEVIAPYRPLIQAAGFDESKAVATLLNAHFRLTQGPPDQRRAAYEQLGRDLGMIPQQQQAQIPPAIQQIMQEQQAIKQALMYRQQVEFNELRDKTTSEVEAFAKDKPDFDTLAPDIVAYINAGEVLEEAYKKAKFANPVTRQKEIDRLIKEEKDKLLGKSKAGVDAARKATAANVKGRDTGRTPTEPKGKFLSDETMKETLRAIRENDRTH